MNNEGKHIITRFLKRWQWLLIIEIFLYALAVSLLIYVIAKSFLVSSFVFLGSTIVLLLFKKPWSITVQKVALFLDVALDSMESSTGLLLVPESELTNLALLQRHTVTDRLKENVHQVHPDVYLKKAFLLFLSFGITAFLIYYIDPVEKFKGDQLNSISKENIVFQPIDSAKVNPIPPSIINQKLTIQYPGYTKLPPRTTSNMNIKALEGSHIYWNIQFDQEINSAYLESNSGLEPMKSRGEAYTKSIKLSESSFYNFKFIDSNESTYVSDLYAIEMVKDEHPRIEVQNLKQFSTFNFNDDKILKFNVLVSDDFGLEETYIVATVTKGEGESVKFREERLVFEQGFSKGSKNLNLNKTLRLDALQMEAGDELYFYVESIDVKRPKHNRTRSETYFAVIRDTVSNHFAVEGTMGADLMPDYFRSQRQLIIDTEKLIADKNKLPESEFNALSNELGFDQKALRLKYGEFMGDETDSGIQVTQEIEPTEEHDENDPLQKYTHDHDGSNEHNLVDHDHTEEEESENKEDPLDVYLHNHDDPEESTLFTQSLKGKLRQAMSEMWDAELHLRLYTPEKSLPFQYRALKLIQEIKNSARIYVHRIGFDPPPIKEDKRLTGEIKDVKTLVKEDRILKSDKFSAMRASVTRLAQIINTNDAVNDEDKVLFKAAANELAVLAIQNPSNYLHTLQRLKWLSERERVTSNDLKEIQLGLLAALPQLGVNPSKNSGFENEIDRLMLKELQVND